MEIVNNCSTVLSKLYETLVNDENAYSPVITINVKDFSESLKISDKKLNLYLWILSDAGYIKCQYVEYSKEKDCKKTITLLPTAFSKIEKCSF